MIPNDPVMLLSFMNMRLRDTGKNLSDLCDDLDADPEEIIAKLSSIDYIYDEERNQFR